MPKVKKRSAAKRIRAKVETTTSRVTAGSSKPPTTTTTASEEDQRESPAATSPTITTMMGPCSDKVTSMLATFRHLLTSYAASHLECAKYAPAISKYMRNKFTFLGLKAPARRALQKEFLAESGSDLEDRRTLMEFVRCLWEQDERDFQGFGVDLLAQYRETLLGVTEDDFRGAVGVVEHCVVTKSWWDTVDAISYPGQQITRSTKREIIFPSTQLHHNDVNRGYWFYLVHDFSSVWLLCEAATGSGCPDRVAVDRPPRHVAQEGGHSTPGVL